MLDKGSVLHGDIYNREFASMLAAFAVAGTGYGLLVAGFGKNAWFYPAALLFFAVSFPLFRRFVFRERYMESAFDRSTGRLVISVSGIGRKIKEVIPLEAVKNVLIEKKKLGIENPDGVAFVEKISAQHGMVIPGFAEEKVIYILKLMLTDETDRTMYVAETMEDSMSAHEKIKEFLKI